MNDNSFHISDQVRGISTAAILSGLLSVVLGVVILAWPTVNRCCCRAVRCVLGGVRVAQVFLAFSLPASAGSRFLTLISGVASVALGIWRFVTSVRDTQFFCSRSGLGPDSSSAVCLSRRQQSPFQGFRAEGGRSSSDLSVSLPVS